MTDNIKRNYSILDSNSNANNTANSNANTTGEINPKPSSNLLKDYNNRILIIDDNEAIHDDFKKALHRKNASINTEMHNLEHALINGTDNEALLADLPAYKIDSAYQGKEGLELIQKSLKEGLPYALAFVDIRMPPGWDGVETIEEIWKVDQNIQTVICTAHSDYSWEEIFKRLGHSDRLLILKKPFDLVEIRLSSLALTKKWMLNKQASFKLEELQTMVDKQTKEIAMSLSMIEATLESTADGIIAIDKNNNIVNYNQKFMEIWNVQKTLLEPKQSKKLSEHMQSQIISSTDLYLDIDKVISEEQFGIYREMQLNSKEYIEQFIQPQLQGNSIVGVVHSFRDVSQRKRLEDELAKQATYDHLTGLPNRILLFDRIQHAILFAKRNKTYVVILFMDLDSFKLVNDSFGHEVGDELLKIFSQRLKKSLRESDTVGRFSKSISGDTAGRLGGDEFVVVLTTEFNDEKNILAAIHRFHDELVQPYHLAGRELIVTLSVGISVYPKDGEDPITLIKNADSAMYRAKEGGKGSLEFYEKEMAAKALARLELQNDLHKALERNELYLNYQPLFDVTKKEIAALEVLLRWNHPKLGSIPPLTFIPIAETSGLIIPIGLWLLRTACKQNKEWQEMGLAKIPISVNISGIQFKQKNIADDIKNILVETGLEPKYLELELTENIIMRDNQDVTLKIHKLKELGVIIDIDDFGTGYSSLSYINQFPVDKIKIDQSFIKKLPTSSESQAIVQAILMIAKSLKMCVVAEGVETFSQLDILRNISADMVQGYYLSHPLSVSDTAKILKKQYPWPRQQK